MKKTYRMLFALVLMALCAMNVKAQDSEIVRTELESEMFKCWSSADADAQEVEAGPFDEGDGEQFGCENHLFDDNIGGGTTLYGSSYVIYRWYANLTGTKKMYFEGTPGIQIRVLYNRPPKPEDGTDKHGGTTPEKTVTIGDDGKGEIDIEALELPYFHLNCLKLSWSSPAGTITKMDIEGTVKGSGKVYSPLDNVTAGFEADVVSINLGKLTNMKQLLGDKERLIFDNSSASLKINGKDIELVTVEGMMLENNARLFLFINDLEDAIDESENETAEVLISFNNPTDDAHKIIFTSGRFKGEALPAIIDLKGSFEDGLGQIVTSKAELPTVISAVPELNSINLPLSQKEFKVTFSGKVDAEKIKATLAGEAMTISPNEGFATELTLTRTGGDLTAGVHEILITNILPEMDFLGETAKASIKYSFGPTDMSQSVQTFYQDDFNATDNKGEGWTVTFAGTTQPANSGSGCRIVTGSGFAPAAIYLGSRGGSENAYAEFGNGDKKLTLEPNTYHLTLGAARWDGGSTERKVKVEVLNEDSETLAEDTKLIEPAYKESTDATRFDLEFTVTATSNIIIRITTANKDGNPGGWDDASAIGDIKVQHIPDIMGIEMMQELTTALESATKVRDANSDARYAGEAFTTLDNLIKASDPKVLQAPTEFAKATADLKVAADAMTAHHKLCDDFDALPAQLYAKIEQFADSKFAADPIYTDMQTAFNKYATVADEEQEVEGVPQVVKVVKPNLITDDTELQAGIDEMNAVLAKAGMFTEGASQNNTTGYAALHERLRLGVATAVALGIEESDAAVVAANAELGDNDDVANALKAAITKKLYANLNTNSTVEEPIDMTVFIKNPNIYVTKASKQDLDAAPGWTINNIGGDNLGDIWYTAGGGTHLATDVVPADEAITSTGNITFTQEITDLPAGVYQVTAYMGERRGDNDFKGFGKLPEELPEGITDEEKTELQLADARAKIFPQEFVFVNTTATAEDQYDNQTPVTTNGKSWGATDNNRIISENITITDGQATIGVKSSGQNTWFAFNEIHLSLVAAAEGFDYSKLPTAIETLEGTPAVKVSAIEMFDINGRRVTKATKGLVIMKQIMSDGTVRTQKVVK